MLRTILGVVLGVIVGVIVIGVIEGAGHTIFPPPPGVNLTDPAQLSTVMSKIPFPAKIAVLLFIVVFIQKRPQGIFALKGRSAEA